MIHFQKNKSKEYKTMEYKEHKMKNCVRWLGERKKVQNDVHILLEHIFPHTYRGIKSIFHWPRWELVP